MPKYVIHKIGFFFTDESQMELPYDVVKGSVVQIFNNLEEAKEEKIKQDILSIQNLKGSDVKQFFLDYPNYNEILQNFIIYYKSEFDLEIRDNDHFCFPDNISEDQSAKFLEIMNITFHNIIEYSDDDNSYNEENKEDFDQLEF